MSFFINHRFGGTERDPPASIFPLLLDELEVRLEDEEHTSISVIHESEWGLGVYYGGYVIFDMSGVTANLGICAVCPAKRCSI